MYFTNCAVFKCARNYVQYNVFPVVIYDVHLVTPFRQASKVRSVTTSLRN
jgi:hypothetical protein